MSEVMDDLIERVQSAIDRPDKPNIIGMHVDDVKALLARIKHAPGVRDEGLEMKLAYDAYRKGRRDALDGIRVADPRVILSRVRAIAEGKDDE